MRRNSTRILTSWIGMTAAAPGYERAKKKQEQYRWHVAVAASPPDDGIASAAVKLDIKEIRWDSHPFDPERFLWFMHKRMSIRPMQWSQIESQLELTELDEQCRVKEKNTLPLWKHYWCHYKNDNKLKKVGTNVMRFGESSEMRPKRSKTSRAKKAPRHAPTSTSHEAVALPLVSPSPIAVLPPPPVPDSEVHREFLLSTDPFKNTGDKPLILQAITSLVLHHTENSEAVRRFLSMKNLDSLGCLYPRNIPSTSGLPVDARISEFGTLEMHRRAMRLEQLASDLLGMLSEAGVDGLTADMAADLNCALAYWGGPESEGASLWREPGGNSDSTLRPTLAWMAANRGDALTRSYTSADELNWGLPLLATIWQCLQAKSSSRIIDKLACEVRDVSSVRLSVYNLDKSSLISYGAHLTIVCRRLRSIADALGKQPAYYAVPILEFNQEHAWRCGNGKLDLSQAHTACKQRLQKEERQIRDLLKGMGLSHSPAVEAAMTIRARQIEKMRTDTHTRAATRHLHPTPSMPDAAFDPRQYIPS